MFGIAKHLLVLTCIALASIGGAPALTAAQGPRPVVFVHGISSEGSTWGIAPILEQQYLIRPIQPDLPSRGHVTYGDQAIALRSLLAADTTDMVAVAHSNGGIATRLARRNGVDFRAITTIGTPHQGAPLAQSLLNGSVSAWAGEAAFLLNDPWFNAPRPNNQYVRFLLALHWSSALSWQIAVELARNAVMNSWAVVPQMVPGSTLLSDTLGTPDVRGNAEQLIPTRVSLQVSAPSATTGIIFSGIMPQHRTAAIAARSAMISVYSAWSAYYYLNPGPSGTWERFRRMQTSQNMALGAASMLAWDRNWCRLIGSGVGSFSTYYGSCAPSDGIVPVSKQFWPGADNVAAVTAGHTAETTNTNIADLVGTWGLIRANVSRR